MDEMRRSRLLRFEQNQQSQPTEEPTTATTAKVAERIPIATRTTASISTTATSTTSTPSNQMKNQDNQQQKHPYTLSNELYSLLWGIDSSQQTCFEDKLRWIQQEVAFKTENNDTTTYQQHQNKSNSWSLGLLQHHGGPCGVLAALQAEMIRFYYFDDNNGNRKKDDKEIKTTIDDIVEEEKYDEDVVINSLLHAMANIFLRSSTRNDRSIRIVLPCKTNWKEIIKDAQQQKQQHSSSISSNREEISLFEIHTISKDDIVPFLQRHNCYDTIYSKEGGIFLFCISLLESRSIYQVKQDMDDSNATLISQFGHCSQEFLNLLLTGVATSNVFDHTIDLGSDTILKGVTSQPDIGYLTQLEFLRYCAVGYFYKTPTCPIWIVGSTHHFTVLFCLHKDILDYDEHGKVGGENKTRDFVKSVFQCHVDDRSEDHGFVKVEVLGKILNQLDLSGKIGGDNGVQTLAAILEVNGAGIILWSDFWNIIRPLMLQQKSFSTILQEHDFGSSSSSASASGVAPNNNKIAIPNNDEEFAKQLYEAENSNAQKQEMDDLEFAKKLQAQWNSEDVTVDNAHASTCMDIVPLPTENSNATIISSASPPIFTGNNVDDMAISDESQQKDLKSVQESSKLNTNCTDLTYSDEDKDDATMANTNTANNDNEKSINNSANNNKDSFIIYHYNGLEGGILSKFRIIPFPSETTSISDSNMSTNSSRDLEDVIRTKWPKCKYDWSVNNGSTMNTARSLID